LNLITIERKNRASYNEKPRKRLGLTFLDHRLLNSTAKGAEFNNYIKEKHL
jgi:hypothetical protein